MSILINKIFAREILDSRGVPTVEAEVVLSDGTKAWAQVPSGSSTGENEAIELRDGDKDRYFGKGVLKAVNNVNTEISELLVGKNPLDQRSIDEQMIELDGTSNKARLGANAILAVSLAVCRAASIYKGLRLYEYIGELYGNGNFTLPVPMFNIINGGKHADSGLAIQEYKIVPSGVDSFKEQYRAGSEIFHELKNILKSENKTIAVGDEGGFAPHLESNDSPFLKIKEATSNAGYVFGKDIFVAIDAAANSFYNDGYYNFEIEGKRFSTEELIDVYRQWVDKYNLISIEDGIIEQDMAGWKSLNEALGDKIMLIGDDLIVTNVSLLQKAIDEKACNSVLIKPNQIGTLSETLDCISLAKDNGFKTVISHRSGETIDDFIADLSVGVSSDFIKTGSLSRGERMAKYNRLLVIEEQIKD